jgi:RNA polymerase sigma factor (sigma-70 family)
MSDDRRPADAAADAALFDARRRFLFGLAYRILGSRAEAEDAVQDVFMKWLDADKSAIATPAAWLTTICTRHCIDQLRSAHKARVDYVGTWLPEPLHTVNADSPEQMLELSSSLSTAFLLLLERLTPKERAAYLLHEIFDMDYPEVAAALGVQEAACRKLVSRARASVGEGQRCQAPPPERQDQLLAAFQHAVASGSTQTLAALLSEDVELCADGGGKASSIRDTLSGRERVLAFIEASLGAFWRGYEWQPAELNGGRGVILRSQGRIEASLSFAYDPAGRATRIYIMRNPDKLAGLGAAPEPRP